MVNDASIGNIHALAARRLIVVWFIASLAIGGFVYYIELKNVDRHVLQLALSGAKQFDSTVIDRIAANDPSVVSVVQDKLAQLLQRDFSLVDVYDPQQAHIATAERFDDKRTQQAIEARNHKFPLDSSMHSESIRVDDDIYMQVLVPLVSSAGETIGYFEGVYHLTQETMAGIFAGIYRTLALVIVGLLTASIALYPVIIGLNRRLFEFARNLLRSHVQLMEVLGSAIAKRDSATNSHNYRVTLYALALGKAVGLADEDMRGLIAGAFLHDVGKIGISDRILWKPESLTETEKYEMQQHVLFGVDITNKAAWLAGAREVIEHHHEKYDGSGYLKGLKGEDIPITARIFAIVDVFDALTSERSYKPANSLEYSLAMIEKGRGVHFDPRLVDAFGAIAPAAFAELARADDGDLEARLNRAFGEYFFASVLGAERRR